MVVELRNLDCIENAFIESISDATDDAGNRVFEYTVTFNYVLPEYEATTQTEAPTEASEESTDESAE